MGNYERKTEPHGQPWNKEGIKASNGERTRFRINLGNIRQLLKPVKKKIKMGLEWETLAIKELGRQRPIFSGEQNEEIVQRNILSIESWLFGFTLNDIRSLTFQSAQRTDPEQNRNC